MRHSAENNTGIKTNAMRILDAAKLPYRSYVFETEVALSGVEVAKVLDVNPDRMFKTLVTVGKSKQHYVFMIPVATELDLKKAAQAVNEKSIAMVKSKELFDLTGYVHGGCSPIGMKKSFTTVIDETIDLFESIIFSAGKIGMQIDINPDDFRKILAVYTADITL